MGKWRKYGFASVIALASLIGGCGTHTPDVVLNNQPHATAFKVNKILNHVKCELRSAVLRAIAYDKANATEQLAQKGLPNTPKQLDKERRIKWLESWSAKLTIKLVVDEKGTLNPGVSFTKLYPSALTVFSNKTTLSTPQSASLGLGGLLSSQATRTETVDYFFVFKSDFIDKEKQFANRPDQCIESGGILVDSDLKIQDWLDAATFPFYLPNNVGANSAPPDVLSHETAFVLTTSGNITPSWKLVNVSANQAASLVSAGRTDTGDLIVTIGPGAAPKSKTPSQVVQQAHFVSQINSAFSASLKGSQ
jgi:hypothetical protein